jgi:PAS domain-containing protein
MHATSVSPSGSDVASSASSREWRLPGPRPETAVLIFADGRVVAANAEWCSMTTLTANASKGDGWLQAFHPDDHQRAVTFMAATSDVYVAQIGMRLAADSNSSVLLRSQLLAHQTERVLRVISVSAIPGCLPGKTD